MAKRPAKPSAGPEPLSAMALAHTFATAAVGVDCVVDKPQARPGGVFPAGNAAFRLRGPGNEVFTVIIARQS